MTVKDVCWLFVQFQEAQAQRDARMAEREAAREARQIDLAERQAEREAELSERQAEREARQVEQAEEREARRDALVLQHLRTIGGQPAHPSYVIGAALKSFRSFDGVSEDGATFLADFARNLGTHQIPTDMWTREVFLKLTGVARDWYTNHFQALTATEFPSWSDLYSALLSEYTRAYQAAGAFYTLCSATRTPGSTGPEVLARIATMQTVLSRQGVPTALGAQEQLAYILQNQLTGDEMVRWTSLANACAAISDATLNGMELRLSVPSARRNTCSADEREHFFGLRVAHLTNFLRDQGAAPTSRHPVPARAAVAVATPAPVPPAIPAVAAGLPPSPPSPAPAPASQPLMGPSGAGSDLECRLVAARADRILRATRQGDRRPVPSPQYAGADREQNRAEFVKRQACGACFACTMAEVDYNLFHTLCPRHGRDSSRGSRNTRVRGSGQVD
jgi:hypothetical protein